MTPDQLVGRIAADLDAVAPSEFASFQRLQGEAGRLAVGDEYVVRMPGPWDGPVRVVASTPTSFRLATLDGHLEAGQVELRASADHRSLEFAIESWARSGDWLSDILYARLRMAKEVQLHMWTSVLERVAELAGGEMEGGIVVVTRHVAPSPENDDRSGTGLTDACELRRLSDVARRSLNFDPASVNPYVADGSWHIDDMTVPLPRELPGPPTGGGSWEITRDLMRDYQIANPATVRAIYRRDAPLAGRVMLLQVRFAGIRFHVGARVGDVYDETREVDGRPARVFGWDYKTLEGHFEQGQMNYEVWKWLDSGEVDFRLHAYSRVADHGPACAESASALSGEIGNSASTARPVDACASSPKVNSRPDPRRPAWRAVHIGPTLQTLAARLGGPHAELAVPDQVCGNACGSRCDSSWISLTVRHQRLIHGAGYP